MHHHPVHRNSNGLKMPSAVNRQVAFIVGPTGVGKTDLSLEIAGKLNADIISADSRYFYKGMDIGTAKPSREEQARVPHHLINVAEIGQPWSLAEFKKAALTAMEDIWERKQLPLVVGGTGQYIRALIEGWDIPARPPDPELRRVLSEWANILGEKELHQQLSILDPAAAEKIDYRNVRRTVRALEVILHTGRKFSEQRNRIPIDYSYKIAGLRLPRTDLYRRIDERIEKMISSGFIEEVQTLLDNGYSLKDSPLSAIGYKEIVLYLNGENTLDESIAAIKKRTRQFVRRQANWFKEDDERIRWFDVSTNPEDEILCFFKEKYGWRKS